jgi:FKBP-type peptidyl-prolyl cis-trans isomerase
MNHFYPKMTRNASFLAIIALFFTFFAFFSTIACNKSPTGCASPTPSKLSEDEQILNYCNANKINYTKDTRGFYYQIIKAGNSKKPSLSSSISITYNGTFLNKSSFDSGSDTFILNDLITGWKYALPLIGEGGEIIIILPSNLGYGLPGQGCIPPSTPLYFNIKLSAVN